MLSRNPFLLSDAELEYWARVYLGAPQLRRRGIAFEDFLRASPEVREDVRRALQLAVRARVDDLDRHVAVLAAGAIEALERGGACCANGRYIEKLRHHRHPVGARRPFIPAREG